MTASLLFSGVAIFAWVRGARHIDLFGYGDRSQEHGFAAIAGQGRLVLGFNLRSDTVGKRFGSWPREAENAAVETGEWLLITGDNGPAGWHEWAGFLVGWGPDYYRFLAVGTPDWFLMFIGMLPAGAWTAYRIRARYRLAKKRCVKCGYDLRGTPGRCPECGCGQVSLAAAG
jgi:hypothetical protein